jgi:hypothetical protein
MKSTKDPQERAAQKAAKKAKKEAAQGSEESLSTNL